jgi:pantetheine-phosphate adenylyltransferase
MQKAAFPGSFDPITFGHLNIIERAASIFDELLIVVAENRQKKYLFSAEERISMIQDLVKPWKNVSVVYWDSFIFDFFKKEKIQILVRGVRGAEDFSYEYDVSLIYKTQDANLETLFLPANPKYAIVSSSNVKELASFGGDVSTMVPTLVNEALKRKFL